MAQHPVPAELMDAMTTALMAANEYADAQEAEHGTEFGLRAFAAEIIDRLAAEGWTLTGPSPLAGVVQCEHKGPASPVGACRTCGDNLLPADEPAPAQVLPAGGRFLPAEHEHVHGVDFRCIICAEDVSL